MDILVKDAVVLNLASNEKNDILKEMSQALAASEPSVSAEDAPKLKPYMRLAEELGSFAGQLTKTSFESVTIDYEGAVAELNTRPLTAIVRSGIGYWRNPIGRNSSRTIPAQAMSCTRTSQNGASRHTNSWAT